MLKAKIDTMQSHIVPTFLRCPECNAVHVDEGEWVTRALLTMTPWTWSLGARLGRTWHRNPNHDQGQHSKERGAREGQRGLDERGRVLVGRARDERHAQPRAVLLRVGCMRLFGGA